MSGDSHAIVSLNSFLVVLLIFSCLALGLTIKKKKFYYLPESGAFMIYGFIIGCFLIALAPAEAELARFKSEIFFFVLLPPIIFEAGYTLKRQDFFINLGTIATYAIAGTLISCIVFGSLLYMTAVLGWVPLDASNPIESFLFGSLVSATDPVATLAIMGAKELAADPLLYSMVFGESVLNDAVAIVLYKTFEGFIDAPFEAGTLFQAIAYFLGVSCGSVVIGLTVALTCCYVFKRYDFSEYPVYEFTLIFLFVYFAYFAAEYLQLSGIMAIFFCAIAMSHYNYYNISVNARIATHDAFKSIAQICETFVFAYIGITAGVSLGPKSVAIVYDAKLIFFTIVFCLISRACNIFPLSWLANKNRELQIPFRMQVPIWFAGLRGAVAFALCLNFPGPNNPYIVSSTLALVFVTTLGMGALTLPVLTFFGMTHSNIQGDLGFAAKRKVVKRFVGWWIVLDQNVMQKWFGDPRGRLRREKLEELVHGHGHQEDHDDEHDEAHDDSQYVTREQLEAEAAQHGSSSHEAVELSRHISVGKAAPAVREQLTTPPWMVQQDEVKEAEPEPQVDQSSYAVPVSQEAEYVPEHPGTTDGAESDGVIVSPLSEEVDFQAVNPPANLR